MHSFSFPASEGGGVVRVREKKSWGRVSSTKPIWWLTVELQQATKGLKMGQGTSTPAALPPVETVSCGYIRIQYRGETSKPASLTLCFLLLCRKSQRRRWESSQAKRFVAAVRIRSRHVMNASSFEVKKTQIAKSWLKRTRLVYEKKDLLWNKKLGLQLV